MKKLLVIIPIVIISLILIIMLFKKDNLKKEDVQGNFDTQFIQQVHSRYANTNYLISPYSVKVALSMLRDGASGKTRKQIDDLIGNEAFQKVKINDQLSVANAIFIKTYYQNKVKKDYTDFLKNNYEAEILYDDMETPEVINRWVNDKTDGMIDKILDSVSKDFVLGLINALSLDAKWQSVFECYNTKKEVFTKNDGSTLDVAMMHNFFNERGHYYFDTGLAKGVILPYEAKDENSLEFVAILPNGDIGSYVSKSIFDEITKIDDNKIEMISENKLNVYLPRFTNAFDLVDFMEVLKSLKITDAFDSLLADFSNIMDSERLYVDLNESGTRASAVTYFGLDKASMALAPEKIFEIKFNKPFIYMIRDKKNKEILFFGTVYEPNLWKENTCS